MSLEKLSIIPLDELDSQLVHHLKSILAEIFKLKIDLTEWNSISDLKKSDFRKGDKYQSTELLNCFSKNLPDNSGKILFITDSDLYSPVFSQFFGEAQLSGKTGIISLFHLKQNISEKKLKKQILVSRILKEGVHEVGHLFGLIHCDDINCAMNLSGNLSDIDIKSPFICNKCSDVLKNPT